MTGAPSTTTSHAIISLQRSAASCWAASGYRYTIVLSLSSDWPKLHDCALFSDWLLLHDCALFSDWLPLHDCSLFFDWLLLYNFALFADWLLIRDCALFSDWLSLHDCNIFSDWLAQLFQRIASQPNPTHRRRSPTSDTTLSLPAPGLLSFLVQA